ncbi:hypothetical protein [Parasitella parasitica]|uniref:RRM domain-containing protein n=1 Tax=Parasitella parasitica TaxID=35722 RepID=A0A0B7MZB4_9FUNG|nr:hypothetical protein [Parasitella parasitica]
MWYLKEYNPIQAGSIDGTGIAPHDSAIDRASQSQYRPPHHLKTDPNCTLFVGRLSFDTEEFALKKHFEKYGEISHASIIRNKVTGLSQGYAFLTLASEKDAKNVYKNANKSTLNGNVVLVDYERSRTMNGWKPRRLGGGFGGKKESGQLRFGARDRPFKQPKSNHVRIPHEQTFSDNWIKHKNEISSKRSRSPSASHHRTSTKRHRSRSPTTGSRYQRHSRRSPSNDSHRQYRSTSSHRSSQHHREHYR